jgi:hypothetical protein
MDVAAIYERIVSFDLPNSKAKPESTEHLYKMIARLITGCAERVQETQQRCSAQLIAKQINLEVTDELQPEKPSQDVCKKKEVEEKNNTQQMAMPDPVVLHDPVVSHDRFGNPLSARGLLLTLWNPTLHATGD